MNICSDAGRLTSHRQAGRRLRQLLVAGGLAFSGMIVNAGMVFPGSPTTVVPLHLSDGSYLWGITLSLGPGEFLLPVQISGALDLQSWQWDLHFDPTVVAEIDPGDGGDPWVRGEAPTSSVAPRATGAVVRRGL